MLLIYSSDGALHIVYTKDTSLHISLEAELNRSKYHYVPKLEPPKQLKLFFFRIFAATSHHFVELLCSRLHVMILRVNSEFPSLDLSQFYTLVQ